MAKGILLYAEILAENGLMSAADVADAFTHWPYLPTLIRLALAVGCGVFVGLEREHHGKAGARTFGLAALLGCLGGLSGEAFAMLSMIFLGVIVCFLNWRQLKLHQTLGLTTSAALLIVGFAGVLCGQGHTFTPVAVAVITAALLAWKQPISGFAVGLSDLELRSASSRKHPSANHRSLFTLLLLFMPFSISGVSSRRAYHNRAAGPRNADEL